MVELDLMKMIPPKCLLLLSLFNRKRALNNPLYIDLDITERCNLQCPGCRYHSPLLPESTTQKSPPGDMDYDMILRVFNEIDSMNTKEIILLGAGEPMLHKRFIDIVREGKVRRFKITILTNGTLLTSQIAQELVASGLDQIKVSLWAPTAEDYEKIHSGTATFWFDRIVSGLQQVQRIKIKKGSQVPLVMIHCPLYQDNVEKLEEMVDRAIGCGVDGLSIAPVYGSFDAARSLLLDSRQLVELSQLIGNVAKKLNQAGIRHNMAELRTRLQFGKAPWQTMPCYVGLYHAKIRTDGKVYPCCRCNIVMGDLKKNTFQEIWNSETYQLFRQHALNAEIQTPFAAQCNCDYCSFIQNNYRIYKFDRFIVPIARLFQHNH